MNHRTYLGDGAYVQLEHGEIHLTTSDGYRDTNRIVLGPTELAAFISWLDRVRSSRAATGAT